MTTILAALLIMVIGAPASAEQTTATADPATQFHRGAVKLRVGLAIAAAGLMTIPLTSVASDPDRSRNNTPVYAGLGAVAVGGFIALSGARDQRRALHPQTAVGFSVGRVNGIQIIRSW